ncbi:MAG: GMC family oxidoreductase [Candidatus Rokubacteria bacterium]|nr:GMC family oxidoreductase [Candidatus Rokubacteria bacterium]
MPPRVAFRASRQQPVGVVIVGCGAGGGVLAKELSEAGLTVLVLEAGRRFIAGVDYRTAEREFEVTAPTVFAPEPSRDRHTCHGTAFEVSRVKGVGGSTLAYLAVVPRFHPSDFRVRSEDGIADDWPLTYEELESYYSEVEYELGVSGPDGEDASPFEPVRTAPYPTPPHEFNKASLAIKRGADRLGWHLRREPLAIPTKPWHGRPACLRAGACMFGCAAEAKSSIDVTYVPKAEATGRVEIRPRCVAREVTVGDDGRARSVVYLDAKGQEHEVFGRVVVLAASAIETPRLLVMSRSRRFPAGLANGSGLVGRYFMEHLAVVAFGVFDERLDAWRGTPAGGSIQDFYETDRPNAFARGFTIEVNCSRQWPLAVARRLGVWGASHRARMKDVFGRMVGLATVGEQLPDVRNTVELDPVVKDSFGLPVPRITCEARDNDRAMLRVIPRRLTELLEAAGAREIWEPAYMPGWSAHYLGTCRMGRDPRTSVVDAWCRAHEVPNLYVGDGSVFVTGAAANPALTIMALAMRTAEGIVRAFRDGHA